jgi:hypothetical protein
MPVGYRFPRTLSALMFASYFGEGRRLIERPIGTAGQGTAR